MKKFKNYLRDEACRWVGIGGMPRAVSVGFVFLVMGIIAIIIFRKYGISTEAVGVETKEVGIKNEWIAFEYRNAILTFGAAIGFPIAWLSYLRGIVNAEQLALAQNQRLDDRLSRAIDQLGSSSAAVNRVSLQLLERIAQNNKNDKEILNVIMRAVQGFVYEKSPKVPTAEDAARQTEKDVALADFHGSDNERSRRKTAAHEHGASKIWAEAEDYFRPNAESVSMAIGILEHFLLDKSYGDAFTTWHPLKLARRYLTGITWGSRDWAGANLVGADFTNGQWLDLNLRNAHVEWVNLTMTQFLNTLYRGKNFFEGADFTRANFLGAKYYSNPGDMTDDRAGRMGESGTFVSKEWLNAQGALPLGVDLAQNLIDKEEDSKTVFNLLNIERERRRAQGSDLKGPYTEEEIRKAYKAFLSRS